MIRSLFKSKQYCQCLNLMTLAKRLGYYADYKTSSCLIIFFLCQNLAFNFKGLPYSSNSFSNSSYEDALFK